MACLTTWRQSYPEKPSDSFPSTIQSSSTKSCFDLAVFCLNMAALACSFGIGTYILFYNFYLIVLSRDQGSLVAPSTYTLLSWPCIYAKRAYRRVVCFSSSFSVKTSILSKKTTAGPLSLAIVKVRFTTCLISRALCPSILPRSKQKNCPSHCVAHACARSVLPFPGGP